MWEVTRHLSHRGNSVRTLITRAIIAILAIFMLAVITTANAFAVGPVSWDGNNLSYEGNIYDQRTVDGTSATPPLANNQRYYVYVDREGGGKVTSNVLYFDSSGTNASTTTSVKYATYDYSTGKYGAKTSGPTDLQLLPRSEAASSTQAAWNGNNLEFDGNPYIGTADESGPRIADGSNEVGLSSGQQYYTWNGPLKSDGTLTLHVISFPADVNVREQTTATYATWAVSSSRQIGSQTGSNRTINVSVGSADNPLSGQAAVDATTCGIPGIGWAVCPLSDFLAWGMDNIFNMLESFFIVQPLSFDAGSGLYKAWNMIRSIANIAFIIAFLIIIFSQLTNFGIGSYGLKKLLPRLVIAAVLVNISYLISALAVDLSNIVGSNLQDILISIRNSLNGPNMNNVPSWQSTVSFILATGTGLAAAGAAIGGLVITTGASMGAALILLLPLLLSVLLAALVALIVLAARQALIIILIILAPLAFVAFLLPNTEKLFDKWRGLFMTMLVFFPLFSLIFGGSQLAAFLLIQTANGANTINIILLALFVQVAPLVLTPLLIRFSGGIIGRIAGMINDPKKGFIDKTRNWAKQQSEFMAAKNMARTDPVRRRQVMRRFALGADQMRRKRDDGMAAYKEMGDAQWTNTQAYSNIQQDLRYAQDYKEAGSENASLRYETSRTVAGRVRDIDVEVRSLKLQVENAKAAAEAQWENNHTATVVEERVRSRVLKDQINAIHSTHDAEYEEFKHGRSGTLPSSTAMSAMMRQSAEDTRLLALNALRADSAKRAVSERFTADLEANTQRVNGQLLQNYAGGIQGINGAQRALASAINAQSKAHNEALANADAILSHANLADNLKTDIALGRNVGHNIVVTQDMREAAAQTIAGGPNATEILRLMEGLEINTSPANQDIRQTFVEALMKNGMKPKFAGAGDMAQWKQGLAVGPGKARMDGLVANAVNADKFSSAENLVNQDRDYLEVLVATLTNNQSTTAISPAARANIRAALRMARDNPLYAGKIAERRAVLERLDRVL